MLTEEMLLNTKKDTVVMRAINIDHQKGEPCAVLVDRLKLLECNVFAMRRLNKMLLAVDNAQVAVREPHAYITCRKPRILGVTVLEVNLVAIRNDVKY